MTISLEDLQRQTALFLQRGYTADGDVTARSTALKDAARNMVEARDRFPAPDGTDHDWRGRSHSYKRWVSEAFSLAGIPLGDRARIQRATAYHLASVLRERLAERGIDPAEIGLDVRDLQERREVRRDREREILRLFDPEAELSVGDLARLASLVSQVLRRLSAEHRATFLTRLSDGLGVTREVAAISDFDLKRM